MYCRGVSHTASIHGRVPEYADMSADCVRVSAHHRWAVSVSGVSVSTWLPLFADMTQEEDQGRPGPAEGAGEGGVHGELVAVQGTAEEETITAKKEDGTVPEEVVATPPSVRQLASSMDSVMVSGMLKNISQKVAITTS